MNTQEIAKEPVDELEEVFTAPEMEKPEGKVVDIKDKAAAWMDKTNQKAIDGATGLYPTIAGVEMAPFSMARASFLRKLDNPFISGVKFSEIEDPFMAVGEFLLMCSVPLAEGRKLVRDKDSLELQALEILERVNALNITEVMEAIVDYTSSELESKVEGESKTETTDDKLKEPGN